MRCGCGHEQELHSHQTDSCEVKGCGCCEFIPNVSEWEAEKRQWDHERLEEVRFWADVYAQEQAEREDNEPPSGSTDLGNPGGTTFCY